MNADHVKSRLHDALHRGRAKVSEDELAEVTAVVLVLLGELATEMATVIAELATRIDALEAAR
jgi:hypothetical protein